MSLGVAVRCKKNKHNNTELVLVKLVLREKILNKKQQKHCCSKYECVKSSFVIHQKLVDTRCRGANGHPDDEGFFPSKTGCFCILAVKQTKSRTSTKLKKEKEKRKRETKEKRCRYIHVQAIFELSRK